MILCLPTAGNCCAGVLFTFYLIGLIKDYITNDTTWKTAKKKLQDNWFAQKEKTAFLIIEKKNVK